MHTAEIEHTPWSRFRVFRSEDTTLSFLGSWLVGVPILTLVGFYFGTIAGHANHPVADPTLTSSLSVAKGVGPEAWRTAGTQVQKDLDPTQLLAAWPFALGGFLLAVAFALWITFVQVPAKLRELELEQGHH